MASPWEEIPAGKDRRKPKKRCNTRYIRIDRDESDCVVGEFKIDDKTVSRKHITLDVSRVKDGSGVSLVRGRSRNRVDDLSHSCILAQSSYSRTKIQSSGPS